tara:strand:- start:156 stop:593 length:438 start_codon:yes stop_codon:yes gene_type:complete
MGEEINIDQLLKAVQNEENKTLINTNFSEIKKIKNDILQKLQLTKEDLKDLHKKLSKYRYVDEISDLRFGSFIRYIPIDDPDNMYLACGGLLCDIIINDDGVNLTFKTFTHRHFQIKMQECLLFQKLSNEEHILLSAIEYVEKNK